ncbi:hypothetical protein BDN67DRAFT_615994 [Paxillus ammoniavirescens]|nr:hypothetical protein BDN67DRAFT_615994 [Paxillus ammoniavirescens]
MANTTVPRKRYKAGADPSGALVVVSLVAGNGRVKRGQLAILPSLPIEILCEIFCFLHPGDLLALVRTSKAFRRLLMSRSTAFVWRAVRRNVDGLPEPPSDMNEVQYAALVFGMECSYEGCYKKARYTIWHLRIRSCASCRPKHKPIKENNSPECCALRRLLGFFPVFLDRYLPRGPFLTCKGNPIEGFHGPHMKVFQDELQALPVSEREVYLERRQLETQIANSFAAAGVEWQLSVRKERIMELQSRQAARAETIREMLVEGGFRDEIEYFGWDRISRHPLIKRTQALTDKARSNVLEHIEDHMSGWRELRIEGQVYASRRKVFLDAWFQFTTIAFHNSPPDCPYLPLPPDATIGFSENIDSVIRQCGQVPHESLLQQLFVAFLPTCDYILVWHREVRRELASLLPSYKPDDDDETVHTRLKLATSVFRCTTGHKCQIDGRALAYPEILFHPCFTLVGPGDSPSPKDPRGIANQRAYLAMGGRPWSCKGRVQVHHKQDAVAKILTCCGKDPRTTAAAEMDVQDPRLVCVACARGDRLLAFMSWRQAVQHSITFHPNSSDNRPWVMAPPFARACVNQLESPDREPLPSTWGGNVFSHSICLLCPPRIPSWHTCSGFGDLVSHINNRHGVALPVFGRDYAFDTNIVPIYPPPVIAGQGSQST